ncbi:hypothetical protein CTAYLR_008952 [Chrysophaeum taylorii]|uniref:Protein SYS1 homolog n=1 Tax=Chrysophaeum taylorii TaxID=2483200 RepID=A0AAD7UMF3_9STRA|nr:hypothetical protein CTAYLR_008952 [Chrysophaeum taylorii]
MKRQDPLLISFQIVSLQCFYYAFMGIFFMGCHVIYGLPLSLDRFFSLTRSLDVLTESGGLEVLAIFASGLVGATLLRTIVEKSRKCLDFAVTLYIIHAVTCVVYSDFTLPNLTWWIVHFVALVVMVVLGEYLCSRRELQDIPLVS